MPNRRRFIRILMGGCVAPVNSVAPAVTGDLDQGATLTGTDGTFTGDVTILSRQWKRNGVDIVGETNNTYVIAVADANQSITFVVTATGPCGVATGTSNTVVPYDEDASAFFAAVGGLSATEKGYFNTYVLNRKTGTINGTDTWTDCISEKAIAGSSSAQHAVDLRFPGSFGALDVNSPTHSQNKVTTSAGNYWDQGMSHTNYSNVNSFSFYIWQTTDGSAPSSRSPLGAFIAGANIMGLESNLPTTDRFGYFLNGGTQITGTTNGAMIGCFGLARTAALTGKFYDNGTIIPVAISGPGVFENINDWWGCLNFNGTPIQDCVGEKIRGAYFDRALTDPEYADYEAANQILNTQLGL